MDGKPTDENPYPSINIGYVSSSCRQPKRAAPKIRSAAAPPKQSKRDFEEVKLKHFKRPSRRSQLHLYMCVCDMCVCDGLYLGGFCSEGESYTSWKTNSCDRKMQHSSKAALNDLVNYLSKKAGKMRYWSGSKNVISTKVPRKFKSTSP